jgi:hypothetical protein
MSMPQGDTEEIGLSVREVPGLTWQLWLVQIFLKALC